MLEDKSKKRKTSFKGTNIQQDYVAMLQYLISRSANHFSLNAFSSTFISKLQIKTWYCRKHYCSLMIFCRIEPSNEMIYSYPNTKRHDIKI